MQSTIIDPYFASNSFLMLLKCNGTGWDRHHGIPAVSFFFLTLTSKNVRRQSRDLSA